MDREAINFVSLFALLENVVSNCLASASDYRLWLWAMDGKFLVASLFSMMTGGGTWVDCHKWIWNSWVPLKVQCFTWKILHDGVLTDVALQRWGFYLASRCIFCCLAIENLWHLL